MSHIRLRQYCGASRLVVPRAWSILLAVVMLPFATLGASHGASAQTVPDTNAVWVGEQGAASYYGSQHQGRRTAAGTKFDQRQLTAAHPWLPFGTRVRVTELGSGKSVIVTITDRLYSKKRIIDLSTAAAKLLGMMRAGVVHVSLAPA